MMPTTRPARVSNRPCPYGWFRVGRLGCNEHPDKHEGRRHDVAKELEACRHDRSRPGEQTHSHVRRRQATALATMLSSVTRRPSFKLSRCTVLARIYSLPGMVASDHFNQRIVDIVSSIGQPRSSRTGGQHISWPPTCNKTRPAAVSKPANPDTETSSFRSHRNPDTQTSAQPRPKSHRRSDTQTHRLRLTPQPVSELPAARLPPNCLRRAVVLPPCNPRARHDRPREKRNLKRNLCVWPPSRHQALAAAPAGELGRSGC